MSRVTDRTLHEPRVQFNDLIPDPLVHCNTNNKQKFRTYLPWVCLCYGLCKSLKKIKQHPPNNHSQRANTPTNQGKTETSLTRLLPRIASVMRLPMYRPRGMFSRAWHQSHVFSRLASVKRFPALGIGHTFSRAWHQSNVFPRLASVTRFLALGISQTFSRAWHRSYVFPRLAPVARFLAFGIGDMFSRAWHQSHIFTRLAPVASFPALGNGCTFFRPGLKLHGLALISRFLDKTFKCL